MVEVGCKMAWAKGRVWCGGRESAMTELRQGQGGAVYTLFERLARSKECVREGNRVGRGYYHQANELKDLFDVRRDGLDECRWKGCKDELT